MEIIREADLTMERLFDLFTSRNLLSSIKEVHSAEPALNLGRDALVDVLVDSDTTVVVWIDTFTRHRLRMRVVVTSREVRQRLDETALVDWEADLNQQMNELGMVSTRNLLGITVEYALPYRHGILDETVVTAAIALASKAAEVRESLRVLAALTCPPI